MGVPSFPAEAGIAEMMKDIFTNYDSPLTEKTLCNWHAMLMSGRRNREIGKYRTHKEAMQVVSGRYDRPKVHFEAPPSADVPKEMEKFIGWFNKSAPGGKEPMTPLVRAGIAHIYFVSIHPFEDGNGRIGRGIVEKSLSQNMGQPTLIAISSTIDDRKREYYEELAAQSTGNDVTNWLVYFGKTIISAQKQTIKHIDFIITKAKLFDTHKKNLNPRMYQLLLQCQYVCCTNFWQIGLARPKPNKERFINRPALVRPSWLAPSSAQHCPHLKGSQRESGSLIKCCWTEPRVRSEVLVSLWS
jgi:Fic family protein